MQIDIKESNMPDVLIVGKIYQFIYWDDSDRAYVIWDKVVCIESCDLRKQAELFNNISDVQDTKDDWLDPNRATCQTFADFLVREKYLHVLDIEDIYITGKDMVSPVGLDKIAEEYAEHKKKYDKQ